MCFSEAGGYPQLVLGGSLRPVSGAIGHVFPLHQRGGHAGASTHPPRAQRSTHGVVFLPDDILRSLLCNTERAHVDFVWV